MVLDYLLNQFPSRFISLAILPFDEYVSHMMERPILISLGQGLLQSFLEIVRYLLLRDLDLAPRSYLKMSDSLTTFANDQPYTFIRYSYYDCIRAWRSVWRQQKVFYVMPVDILAQLLSVFKLLRSYLIPF